MLGDKAWFMNKKWIKSAPSKFQLKMHNVKIEIQDIIKFDLHFSYNQNNKGNNSTLNLHYVISKFWAIYA